MLPRSSTSWGRHILTATALLLCFTVAACGNNPDESDTATSDSALFDAPTKEEVAEIAGVALPAEASDFRAVSISETEINIRVLIPLGSLELFLTDSDVDLKPETRVITHASPVWDLNEEGSYSGGTSTLGALTRTIEVVDSGSDSLVVRIAIRTEG